MLATNPAVDATTGRTRRTSASTSPTPKWVAALAPPLIAYRISRPASALRGVGTLLDHPLLGHRGPHRLSRLLLHQVAGPAPDLLVDAGQVLADHTEAEQDERAQHQQQQDHRA